MNKKGIVWNTLITIILIIASFTIIIWVTEVFFSKAEGAASEQLCRTTNVIYAKGDPTKDIPFSFNLRATPQACKSQNVDDVPTGKYAQDDQGAMKNVADLMTKCWWKFLEGTEPELLGKRGLVGPDEHARCIVCYRFTLQEGMSFMPDALLQFLQNSPYRVQDPGDKCSTSGGICESKCPDGTTPKSSVICTKKQKGASCCVADNECENKGGKCQSAQQGEFTQQYDKWGCPRDKKCFVKKGNFITYADYIQRANGMGYIAIDSMQDSFRFGNQGYAIAYVSNIEFGILSNSFDRLLGLYRDYKLNGIIIGRKEEVEKYCYVQPGAGEG